MNMIQAPTDNLYKFCAIFGLLIIFFSSYHTISKIYDLIIETYKINTEIEILKIDCEYFRDGVEKLRSEAKIFKREDEQSEPLKKMYLDMLTHYQTELKEMDEQSNMISRKQNLIHIQNIFVKFYIVGWIISLIIGLILSFFGFKNWYKMEKK